MTDKTSPAPTSAGSVDIEAFAKNPNDPHLPAWRDFNKRVGASGDVGVYHETYRVGPGQFENQSVVSAHSIYIRVLAEQGVLGLVTLAALLAGTLALAVGNALAGRDAHGVGSAALLGAWCGLLANSAFVDTLHWRHLWLVAALVWVAAMRARR